MPEVKYVIPQEGAVRGSDTMVIPSGAPPPIAANLWIDFNLDAHVSAENTNYIGYMGPNAAAREFIDPAILGDQRHIQLNVSPADGTTPEELLQDTGNLLIGHFGIFGLGVEPGGGQEPLGARGGQHRRAGGWRRSPSRSA